MKTNNIAKWTTLLTVSGILSTAPLTLSAAVKVVNTTGVTYDANNTYESVSGTAGLYITGNTGVIYSGTNIRVNSSIENPDAGRHGMVLNGTDAVLDIFGGTVTTSGSRGYGVSLERGSGTLRNMLVSTQNTSAYGVAANTGATVTVINSIILTSGTSSYALFANTGCAAYFSDLTVSTTAYSGYGLATLGTISGTGLKVTTYGDDARAVQADGASVIDIHEVDAQTYGDNTAAALIVHDRSTMRVTNGSVQSHGDSAAVILSGNGTVSLTLTHVNVSADLAHGINIGSGTNAQRTLEIDSGSVTAASDVISIHRVNSTAAPVNAATAAGYSIDADITVSNGAVLTGSAVLYANSIRSGTDSGGNLQDITTPVTVRLNASGASVLTGEVIANGDANVTLNLSGNSALTGNLVTSNTAALTVTLDNSTLTSASILSDNATTNLTLNNSAWNLTGKSKLTTLTSSGGSITIANVQGDDLTVSNGITGQTALHLTLSDGVKDQTEIRVIVDETNAMSDSAFTLGSEVSNGMYDYVLENNADGAWLVYTAPVGPPVNPPVNPIPPPAPIISAEGDAVLNTAAAVSAFWFTQLDNLHKRMGELRYNKPAGGDLINNVWIRAYGQQINASTNLSGVKGFSETQYGVDLGTDHLWNLDADNQLYTGIFAGYGGADRQFHSSYNGSTDSGYGGLYATWINKDGWYADVVAKGQYFSNEFSGADRGDYDSLGMGFSVEFGRRFEFKDGWFAEPSVQFSYLHLMNDNYTTRDEMYIDLTDADVLHIYGGARFGRNIKLTNSTRLQPYIKAGGLGQISSGNQVTVSGDHWRPNLDGARAVVGAGIVWQLDVDSQLHLDYEASFGEKYDKPWGVNFGYRYQF